MSLQQPNTNHSTLQPSWVIVPDLSQPWIKFSIYIALVNPYFGPKTSPQEGLSSYPNMSCVETMKHPAISRLRRWICSCLGNPVRILVVQDPGLFVPKPPILVKGAGSEFKILTSGPSGPMSYSNFVHSTWKRLKVLFLLFHDFHLQVLPFLSPTRYFAIYLSYRSLSIVVGVWWLWNSAKICPDTSRPWLKFGLFVQKVRNLPALRNPVTNREW